MPRQRHHAILILSPTRIEFAPATSDEVRSMSFSSGVWRDAVASGFRPFDAWLTRAAAESGMPKSPSVSIHVSGTGMRTDILQTAGPERAAIGIAHATMSEQFDLEEGLYQVAVCRLEGRPDPDSKAARYFIAAETDTVLDRIVSFAERAGFCCSGVAPLARSHALRVSRLVASGSRLVCDLGEHESIVALGEDGVVPLFRPFSVGAASFIDAYSRVLEQAGIDDPQDTAREFVFRFGVPERDQMLDESRGLTGRDVLPLLQPVIQRFAVEIKNTIRFGLEGRDPESLRVEMTGLAAEIPGISGVLSSLLDTEIVARDTAEGRPAPPYLRSLEPDGAKSGVLRPLRLIRQAERSRLKKMMRFGAAAAMVALGAEALVTYGQIRRTSAELAALSPRVEAVRSFNVQSTLAERLAGELDTVRAAIDERIGGVGPWAPALNAIASSLPESIDLVDCRGFRESGALWYRLSGEVTLSSNEDRTLGAFLDTLEKSDFIETVELESARVEQRREAPVQRFVVRLRLVSIPAAPRDVMLVENDATPAEGGTP